MYEIKEAPQDNLNQSPEPEVVKAVQDEIKKLGDNTKANYDDLHIAYEALKSVIDKSDGKVDALVKAQMTKLTEDITTRQEALDAKVAESIKAEKDALTQRIDAVETAMKRTPLEDPAKSAEELSMEKKAAMDFMIYTMVVKDKGDKGATYDRVNAMKADVEGYKNYKKAFETFLRKDERFTSPENLKTLSVGSDPDGGYTVTPVMSNRIITRLFEGDALRDLAAVETISTGAIEWLVDWDEAGWGWEGETETGAETSTPQLYKKRIPVHVMYAKPRATQTLLEDSSINIENWLADKVADRFTRGEGAAFVTGNGVGKPRGFETYANGTGWGQVAQVAMLHATALTADGFIAVKYSLVEQYLNRGTWLMNRSTVADAMYLKDGAGRYIWKPGMTDDKNSTILGLPVRMSTTMPAVAASALSVALADWKEAYMIVDRLGITVQRDPYSAKPYVEFYTRKRVGGDVTNFQAIKLGIISA
jgi:HK97 family phage major capsid protein